jgi:FtsP/CotA-like multicopper oxidase with cupredoxin domain
MKRLAKRMLIGLGLALALASGGVYALLRASILPPAINMSSAPMDHVGMVMPKPAPSGLAAATGTPLTQLVEPPSAAPVKRFVLTAQMTTLDLGAGQRVAALTFNGSAPGPELHVQQGDQVEVTLNNKDIADGVTIHWHGVNVPNAMDGVAGVTQDAVKPGAAFTYRFIAKDAGA